MTSGTVFSGDPRRRLAGTLELTRQVRGTQRATWFPLLVLAVVTFAAIAFRYSPHRLGTCAATGPARGCTVYPTALLVYWPTALVLAYVVIALSTSAGPRPAASGHACGHTPSPGSSSPWR